MTMEYVGITLQFRFSVENSLCTNEKLTNSRNPVAVPLFERDFTARNFESTHLRTQLSLVSPKRAELQIESRREIRRTFKFASGKIDGVVRSSIDSIAIEI